MLTTRFTEAVEYARVHHADDVRKGTAIPYVSHLLAVCALVLEHGDTESEANRQIPTFQHSLGPR